MRCFHSKWFFQALNKYIAWQSSVWPLSNIAQWCDETNSVKICILSNQSPQGVQGCAILPIVIYIFPTVFCYIIKYEMMEAWLLQRFACRHVKIFLFQILNSKLGLWTIFFSDISVKFIWGGWIITCPKYPEKSLVTTAKIHKQQFKYYIIYSLYERFR